MAQWIKYCLALSLQQHGLLLWYEFSPWPENAMGAAKIKIKKGKVRAFKAVNSFKIFWRAKEKNVLKVLSGRVITGNTLFLNIRIYDFQTRSLEKKKKSKYLLVQQKSGKDFKEREEEKQNGRKIKR